MAFYPVNDLLDTRVFQILAQDQDQDIYHASLLNLKDAETYKVIVTPANDNVRHPPNVKVNNMAIIEATTTPARLSPPSIRNRGQHTISVAWERPLKIADGASIRDYVIQYDR